MKNFKKIISLVLAAILIAMTFPVVAFAAEKGDVNGDGSVSATDARFVLQVVAGIKKEADLKDAAAADVDGKNGITATDARRILQIVAGLAETPTKPSTEYTKAQLASLFNAETAKAAKGTYNWTRTCEFTKDIDVGNASETLNRIIKMIDENADLNSVIGGFLGVGSASGTQKDAGKYSIIPMKLTEDDIKSFKVTDKEIIIALMNSKNPSNGGNTAFNHASNDFVTEEDVKTAISGVTTAITVNSCTFNYSDIQLVAGLDANGNPVSLKISYTMSATMGLKVATININGNGEVKTEINYTNLNY